MISGLLRNGEKSLDLISGPEDGGELRPPVVGVLVGCTLSSFSRTPSLCKRLYDSCCAFLQYSETCASRAPQHNWCPALPSAGVSDWHIIVPLQPLLQLTMLVGGTIQALT